MLLAQYKNLLVSHKYRRLFSSLVNRFHPKLFLKKRFEGLFIVESAVSLSSLFAGTLLKNLETN